MKSWFWISLLCLSTVANASDMSREDRIKKRVQLGFVLAESDFCDKEIQKLKSNEETAFFFNKNYPAETNARWAKNKLTYDEKTAYSEFVNHCNATSSQLSKLLEELQEKH